MLLLLENLHQNRVVVSPHYRAKPMLLKLIQKYNNYSKLNIVVNAAEIRLKEILLHYL